MIDIGIDLGTTYSVVAVNGQVQLAADYPRGFYLEECDVTIIPTPEGELSFPSVLLEDPDTPGQYLLGEDALQRPEVGVAPVMFSKRKIGTREQIALQTHTLVAKDVAREFLRHMKSCAERALGQPVSRAVVTHPAYFDRSAVEETRDAAIEAGFDMSLPEQMLMEPVAAALAYTRTDDRDPLRVLTYDLGGGTFDVTYLTRSSGVIDMKSFEGDHLLGGYDFDKALVHWLLQTIASQGRQLDFDLEKSADRGRLSRLLRLAENVKIHLAESRNDTSMVTFRSPNILVDSDGRPIQFNERISRGEFVSLIKRDLERTVAACRRALDKAGASPEEVDAVLLVGGSTNGPWVEDCLREAFPGTEPQHFHPALCVGAGAAIHAKMILPPLVMGTDFQLTLDVPEFSFTDTLNVAGRLTGADGVAASEGHTVALRIPTGRLLPPVELEPAGDFLFEEVELKDDGPSRFVITVYNPLGARLLQHEFRVTYAPEKTETSTVRTVLPKPLYVETLDGLVALAAEGVVLPARCEQTFQRENDNPNLSLRLYQEDDPIGEIRVSGIPPEGGRGSLVDLSIEVTEKNQVRGVAVIRRPDGTVVLRSNVRVVFELPEVPSEAELRRQFSHLEGEYLSLIKKMNALREGSDRAASVAGLPESPALIRQRDHHDAMFLDQTALLAATGDKNRATELAKGPFLIEELRHLLELLPVERQAVSIALRQLHNLVHPRSDDMVPTREEYREVVSQCRAALAEMTSKAEAALSQNPAGAEAKGLDRGLIESARLSMRRAEAFALSLDGLEEKGMNSHASRDRRSWGRCHDSLTDLRMQIRGAGQKQEDTPPPVTQMIATLQIMHEIGRLKNHAKALETQGKMADWQGETSRIERGLMLCVEQVQNLDTSQSASQFMAQVRMVFARQVQPLLDAMEKLGVDVSVV